MLPDDHRLAAWEARLRPLLAACLPPALAVRLYSRARRRFLARLVARPPAEAAVPDELFRDAGLERTLWGVRFRSPLLNAAGTFKDGRGYRLAARQGAAAFFAGTTTARPRTGNRRRGVDLPFAPYPRSQAASNWLGLPNPGHGAVARRLAALAREGGCPVGASVAACPDAGPADAALDGLVEGLELYERAGVDFLEMNESCPNTGEACDDLEARLERVSRRFLARRPRRLPVVVKLSCDTPLERVGELVDLLVEHGYDGVDFGNTSTAYGLHGSAIAPRERRLFAYFTATFGGGLSGTPLRETSLGLASAAVEHLRRRPPSREFHVVRTGGVAGAADLVASERAGAALTGWYTGYFEAFSRSGHALYRRLYEDLARLRG